MTQISLFAGSAPTSSSSAAHHNYQTAHLSVPGRLKAFMGAVQEWQERYRSRRDLMRLSEYQLKDIGLSRFDAESEYRKPFWRG